MTKMCTAAAIQWMPEFHNAQKGAIKAAQAIAEAASQGADLVVFPEVWLQGYPYWAGLSVRDPDYRAFRQILQDSAVTVPGPELQTVQDAAAKHHCLVVISLHEIEGATLYATLVYIGPDGKLLGKHRKLMPTYTERLYWGMGDGSDLAAYDTELGRVGGLMCFEHQMTLARYALATENTQIHASAWPGQAMLDPIIDASARQLAHENGCFVIVARDIIVADRLDPSLPNQEAMTSQQVHGGSAIIAPGGAYLADPVFDEETIVTAELDMRQIDLIKSLFDNVGHYARTEIFSLQWNRNPKPAVKFSDGEH